jgi:NodT family efflux transporter outer membrane factor (OMF) lipoprotein
MKFIASGASIALLAGASMLLAACTVGPNYHRPPAASVPVAYREVDGWKPATPREAASGTAWWTIYDDPALDELEGQIAISNQNLKAAEAAYRQAQAIVAEAQAGYYPTVTASGDATRSSSATQVGGASRTRISNEFTISGGASWAPDLWGRIRRTVESSVASAQSSAADIASARLSAQGTLAADYIQLRIDDDLKRVFDQTIEADRYALNVATNQFDAGFAPQTDVITAQTNLEGAQAQAINIGVQRAQLEHAIAVLVGKSPAGLTIAPAALARTVPVVPAGIPSTLLERRPDIAVAERTAAAAHAQIGVAIAAYYPDITLTASTGFGASMLQNLLTAAGNVWSVGPAVAETVFDGGLRDAQVQAARAAYDQSVASYRQTVLTAFQQVEDELSTLRILESEAKVEESALRSSREALRLTLNQYQAGTVAYTAVVLAQNTELADEQSVLTILQNRLIASVALVQALGGGWSQSDLPPSGQIEAGAPSPEPAQR